MGTTSRVPAILDALVDGLAELLPDVVVIDGGWASEPDGDYLTVGWSPLDDISASSDQSWAGIGRQAKDESFDIVCYLDSWSGDTDATSVRDRRAAAYSLLGVVETWLRGDPTLGGVVPTGQLQIGSVALRQEQTEAGYAVGLTFHITGTGRI